jgi:hypothetical protein
VNFPPVCWRECNERPSHDNRLQLPQIKHEPPAAWRQHPPPNRSITGERLTAKNSHVDHMRPLTFQRLARDFLASRKLRLEDLRTTKAGNVTTLTDRDIADAWQQYHRENAKLRIASKRANLKERKPAVDFRPTPTLF